jgi:hypothetical protein
MCRPCSTTISIRSGNTRAFPESILEATMER